MWQAPVTHLTPCYTEPPCPANSPPRAFPWDDTFQRCTPHFECKNCKLWCQLLKQEGNKETDVILLAHKLWLPNRSSLFLCFGYILPLGNGHGHPLDSWPDASKHEKQRHPISLFSAFLSSTWELKMVRIQGANGPVSVGMRRLQV